MFLFGLAWVASIVGSGMGAGTLPGEAQTGFHWRQTWPGGQSAGVVRSAGFDPATLPGLAAPALIPLALTPPALTPPALAAPTLVAPTLASVNATAPVGLAATLLPKWLSSQNGILDFAQPLTRWLAGSPSLHNVARHPRAFSPEDKLACFSGSISRPAPESSSAANHQAKASGWFASKPSQSKSSQSKAAQTREQGDRLAQYEGFSTWVRSCLLRDLSDPAEVEAIATRIEAALVEAHWDGEKVLPTLAENLPSGKIGDRLLFIITPEIAEAVGVNAELVTTQWINELRLVLGAAPLELAESQIHIHGLKPTGKYLSGEASWYGHYFQGRLTATGEIFDKEMFTAAHKELPFDTYLRVTNLHTGNVLIVRINDRGPYVGDRALDLSQGSANYLGSPEIGVVNFKAEFMEPAKRLQASLPYRATEPDQDPLITMWRP